MGYSIKWPLMPSIGAVDLHSVGNQNFTTGFSIDYDGPRGRVTVYTKCWLTEGMRLTTMFDNYGTIPRFTSKFHLAGDAGDAEEAVKLFLANNSKQLVSYFIGAANNEFRVQQETRSHLLYSRYMLTNYGQPDFEMSDGVTRIQALEDELTLREARVAALEEFIEKAADYSRKSDVSEFDFLKSLAVNEVDIPDGAVLMSVKCERAVASEVWAKSPDCKAILVKLGFDHYRKRDYSETVSFKRIEEDSEPFMHTDTSVQVADIRDEDCLILRSLPSISVIQGRLQRALATVETNPDVVIVSPSGNLCFKAKDLIAEMSVRSPHI